MSRIKKFKPFKENKFSYVGGGVFALLIAAIGIRLIISSFAVTPVTYGPNLINNNLLTPQTTTPATNQLVAQTQQDTSELTTLVKASSGKLKNPSAENKLLDTVSGKRLSRIQNLLSQDPAAVKSMVLPSSTMQTAQSLSGVSAEKSVTLNGVFAYFHADSVNKSGVTTDDTDTFELVQPGKDEKSTVTYKLFSSDLPALEDLKSGQAIEAKGSAFGNDILLSSLQATSATPYQAGPVSRSFVSSIASLIHVPKAEATATTGQNNGTLNTAIIAIDAANGPSIDMAQLKGVVENWPNNNVVGYFKENSFGQTIINPTIFGPYTLPASDNQGGIGFGDPSTQAFQDALQLASKDVTFANYQRIIFVVDDLTGKGTDSGGGWAYVGPSTLPTPQGNVTAGWGMVQDAWAYSDLLNHELGHTMGVIHAWYQNCGNSSFDAPTRYGSGCSPIEYFDPFSVMGHQPDRTDDSNPETGSYSGDFDEYFKYLSGWTSSSNIANVNSPGTYTETISPLEITTPNVQAVDIARDSVSSFWVDYRQAIGYDSWIGTSQCPGCNANEGPMIHFVNNGALQDSLIDATPESDRQGDMFDSALLPGKTFTDPGTGITITTNWANSSGTNITVVVPPAATCTPAQPTISVANPNQTGSPGQTVNYSVTVTNNDSSSCKTNSFHLATTNPLFAVTVAATPDVFNLAPGASEKVNLAATLSSPVPNSSTNETQTAYFCTNNPAIPCTPFNYTLVQVTPPDTTTPSAPVNLQAQAVSDSQVNLSWQPSNDSTSAIGQYVIERDGSYLDTTTSTSYIDSSAAPGTQYTYNVYAFSETVKESPLSTAAYATTPPAHTNNYTAPSGFNLNVSYTTPGTAVISWTTPTDSVPITRYDVSVFDSSYTYSLASPNLSPSTTSYTIHDLVSSGSEYRVLVDAYDANDGVYGVSEQIFTPKPGTQPPSLSTITSHVLVNPYREDIFYTPSQGAVSYSYFNAGTALSTVDGYGSGEAVQGNFSDGTSLGTSTYPSFGDNFANDSGGYDFVEAIDANGNISLGPISQGLIQAPVPNSAIPSDTTPPTAQISSPYSGSSITGNTSVNVSALDNIDVSGVELYVDGNMVGAVSNPAGNSSQYLNAQSFSTSVSFNSANFSNGSHTLVAKAYDGWGGNVGNSAPVTVNFNNASQTKTPPNVSITSPANNSTVVNTLNINATASGNSGASIVSVSYYIDGSSTPAGTDTTSPYNFSWNTDPLSDGTHTITVTALDSNGATSSSTITVDVNNTDHIPPTVPGTPTTQQSPTALTSPNWTWAVSSDSGSGLAATPYTVQWSQSSSFSSGVSTGTSTTNGINTPNLTNGTWYVRVSATDADGNVSAYSATGSVVIDTTPPAISISSPTSGATVSGLVSISASASDSLNIPSVQLYIDGSPSTNDTSAPYTYSWNTTGVTNGSHNILVKATDAVGNTASAQITVNVANVDITPPSAPTKLGPSAPAAYNQVSLSWSASTDNVGVKGYYVLRSSGGSNYQNLTPNGIGTTSYPDNSVSASTSYSYEVEAYDGYGNISTPSNIYNITTPAKVLDTTPPTTPTGLQVKANSSTQLTVSWNASTDNVAVAGYNVYFYGQTTPINPTPVTGLSLGVTGLYPSTYYAFYVKAVDTSNNLSGPSYIQSGLTSSGPATPDTTPPTVPGTPSTPSPTGSASPNWTWAVSTDTGSGLAATPYTLQWSQSSSFSSGVSTATSTNNSFVTPNLSNGTWYVRVSATDAAGNVSAYSAAGSVVVDTTPPAISITAPTGGSTVSGSVSIGASVSDSQPITGVQLYVDGTPSTNDTSAPYTYSWNTTGVTNGSHNILVKATDSLGNTATAQISVTVANVVTVLPPSAPTNLSATAATYNQVNLSWTAAKDSTGTVTGYYVLRSSGGSNYQNLTPNGIGTTSYPDNSVSASTSYSYEVEAYDNLGNLSPASTAVPATTPAKPSGTPTAPPPPLSGVTAVAVSSTQINVSWAASTDAYLAGYDVYLLRGNNPINSSLITNTTYGVTGLTPSTGYSFYVVAVDTAGNTSGVVWTASSTTLAASPTNGTTAGDTVNVIPSPASTATVEGVVTDTTTGLPIAGVSVSTGAEGTATGAATAVTNTSGQYELVNLIPNKSHTYTFSATGYKTISPSANYPSGVTILNEMLKQKGN